MANEEMKNLPPEERIKRLKELEKQRKKEIEEAQKTIKDSEEEITERRKWFEKVPIPQVTQEDFSGLSAEGKEILKVHRNIKDKTQNQDEDLDEKNPKSVSTKRRELSLEDTVTTQHAELSPEAREAAHALQQGGITEYRPLNERPMEELQKEMAEIYNSGQDKGYISGDEARRAFYAAHELERRENKYSFTEETAREASLIKKLGDEIKSMYKR